MVSLLDAPESRAGALALIGGELAFDFANTSSGRGWPSHKEHLRAAQNVIDWAAHAKLLSAADAAWVSARAGADASLAALLLSRALDAREVVHTICVAVAAGRPAPRNEVDSLSQTHAACLACAKLTFLGGRYMWSWEPRETPVEALLGPITLSALATLTQADLGRVKQCQNEKCGWVFFDTTKNKSRRWCEMEICGNRAKQKRLAKRRREG
jgi:predicted RNA-binding Zn ribbon-like protein